MCTKLVFLEGGNWEEKNNILTTVLILKSYVQWKVMNVCISFVWTLADVKKSTIVCCFCSMYNWWLVITIFSTLVLSWHTTEGTSSTFHLNWSYKISNMVTLFFMSNLSVYDTEIKLLMLTSVHWNILTGMQNCVLN